MRAPLPLADLKRQFHAASVAGDRTRLAEIQGWIRALAPEDYRATVDLDELLAAHMDAALFGTGIILDGKRIAPEDYCLRPGDTDG